MKSKRETIRSFLRSCQVKNNEISDLPAVEESRGFHHMSDPGSDKKEGSSNKHVSWQSHDDHQCDWVSTQEDTRRDH